MARVVQTHYSLNVQGTVASMAHNTGDDAIVTTIVARAIAIADRAARMKYLDQECEGDEALRRRVEDLLSDHDRERESGMMETGIHQPTPRDTEKATDAEQTGGVASADDSTGDFRPPHERSTMPERVRSNVPTEKNPWIGKVIGGRYTLVELLGEGGMGAVYRAEQTQPIRRQVALKLIRGGMDTRLVLARFDAERQALALMDHTGIARVFDGGETDEGQPFFVMELVNGLPITEYCDSRRLSVDARLKLFVAVCQAVQHAHQKGIIHRDLKPSNVLVTEVDDKPTPKVIDFGVAKAIEFDLTDQSFGDTGAIVGTPTYMSPEQADPSSMDIYTRTDVYALGVILYELLVGSPPIDPKQFHRGAVIEMLRIVREVDPPRPSTKLSSSENVETIAANRNIDPARLSSSLRGELDWVVMKALEKDRNRRYETAYALGRDLERYLTDEVVEARPPNRAYRLKKFISRNKGQVIAASLLFVALVAGLTGTSLGLFRARIEQARAESEKSRAQQNFATARAVTLDLGQRIYEIQTGASNPKLADLARKQALDKAREQFASFLGESRDDVGLQLQTAALHRFAGIVSRDLTEFRAADSAFASSIQILEDFISRSPAYSAARNELALVLSDRCLCERQSGRLKAASATIDRAIKLLDGSDRAPGETAYHRTLTLAYLEFDRIEIANRQGRFVDFEAYATHANEMLDSLQSAEENGQNPVVPILLAISITNRARAERELGKIPEALAHHEAAVAMTKTLAGPKANRDFFYQVCDARTERARTWALVPERRAAAAEDLVEVIRLAEKLAEENVLPMYRTLLANASLRRGELLTLLGRPDDAIAELTRSLAVSRVLLDRHGNLPESVLVRGETYLALGNAHVAAGKKTEAAAAFKSANNVMNFGITLDHDNIHVQRALSAAQKAAVPKAGS
jgi:serine/threonine protein kinase